MLQDPNYTEDMQEEGSALTRFCYDLTQQAKEKQMDQVMSLFDWSVIPTSFAVYQDSNQRNLNVMYQSFLLMARRCRSMLSNPDCGKWVSSNDISFHKFFPNVQASSHTGGLTRYKTDTAFLGRLLGVPRSWHVSSRFLPGRAKTILSSSESLAPYAFPFRSMASIYPCTKQQCICLLLVEKQLANAFGSFTQCDDIFLTLPNFHVRQLFVHHCNLSTSFMSHPLACKALTESTPHQTESLKLCCRAKQQLQKVWLQQLWKAKTALDKGSLSSSSKSVCLC